MQRGALLTLPFALVAMMLSGCGLFGDSTSVEDALETMPGTVTRVTFFDRAAASERLGLDELDGDSSDETEAYLDEAQALPFRTDLDVYLLQMLDNAPFTALDLEWEVVGYDSDGDYGRAWKMDDDLDLNDVIDELVDLGYTKRGSDDAATLTVDPSRVDEAAAAYLLPISNITVLADEHLIVTGPLADDVLSAVADDTDSLVDTGAFGDLVASADDIEVADLTREDAVCSLGDSVLPPEQLEAIGADDLAGPDQAGFFVHGDDGQALSVMVFESEDAAGDAASQREDFLAEGASPVSGVPYSELGGFDVEADGDQVRIDIDYDNPTDISAAVTGRDYPSVCGP